MESNYEGSERTLCLIKPDGVRRGLSGEVFARIERTGLKIVALKMLTAGRELAGKHYTWEDIGARHGEAVLNALIDFICSGPVIAFVVEGVAAIENVRRLCGTTDPSKSPPGTIRGDFCHQNFPHSKAHGKSVRNIIHASSSPDDAAREIPIWFSEEEIVAYRRSDEDEHIFVS